MSKNVGLDWDAIRAKHDAAIPPERLEASRAAARVIMYGVNAKVEDKQAVEKATGKKMGGQGQNKVPSHIVDKIVELYKGGMTVSKIATEVGYTDQPIRSHLKDRGVYDPTRDRGRNKNTERVHKIKADEESEIFRLYVDEELEIADIVKKFPYTARAVRNLLDRHGVFVPYRKGRKNGITRG